MVIGALALALCSALPARSTGAGVVASKYWVPTQRNTFQWQLSGPMVTSYAADVYDVDLFDTRAAAVRTLHRLHRRVICYVSVGSYEDWRPDASRFPRSVIGKPYPGWPGERWLDVRRIATLAPIMRARLDLCRARGFDAVEPDNIDAYTAEGGTGFPLTARDQIRYNRWLAREAHSRGLSIGLKNDADQAAALAPQFDWALTEDCFQQGWCAQEWPFLAAHKAVFATEYTDVTARRTLDLRDCPSAIRLGITLIYKRRDLGPWRATCARETDQRAPRSGSRSFDWVPCAPEREVAGVPRRRRQRRRGKAMTGIVPIGARTGANAAVCAWHAAQHAVHGW